MRALIPRLATRRSSSKTMAVVAMFILGSLLAAMPVEPGAPLASSEEDFDEASYIVDFGLDLVVATVLQVADSGATVSNPPYVRLRVEKVLRGGFGPRELTARWVPYLLPPFRCGNETASERAEWDRFLSSPMRGPAVGKRMILAGTGVTNATWDVSEYVRHEYDSALLGRLARAVRRLDEQRAATAAAKARSEARERAQDEAVRGQADISALCRQATDILIGSFKPGGYRDEIDLKVRLKSARQDSMSALVDERLESRERGGDREARVLPLQADKQMIWRRLQLPRSAANPGSEYREPDWIMFLRRGPFVPSGGGGYRVFWPADHRNAFLPPDSTTVARIRRELARDERSARAAPAPPEECGARLSQIIHLPRDRQMQVVAKIICLRPVIYSYRTRSLLFGHTLPKPDDVLCPCKLAGERYWHNQLTESYPVSLSPGRMTAVLAALWKIPALRREQPSGEAIASLQLRAPVAQSHRVYEALLAPNDLLHVIEALREVVRPDSGATWKLNYWKYQFGEPLVPDSGFEPYPPRRG